LAVSESLPPSAAHSVAESHLWTQNAVAQRYGFVETRRQSDVREERTQERALFGESTPERAPQGIAALVSSSRRLTYSTLSHLRTYSAEGDSQAIVSHALPPKVPEYRTPYTLSSRAIYSVNDGQGEQTRVSAQQAQSSACDHHASPREQAGLAGLTNTRRKGIRGAAG
jgi:hypothetical protein